MSTTQTGETFKEEYREVTDAEDDAISTKVSELTKFCRGWGITANSHKHGRGHFMIEIVPISTTIDDPTPSPE